MRLDKPWHYDEEFDTVDGLIFNYSVLAGGSMVATGTGVGASLDGTKALGSTGITASVRYQIVANPQTGIQPDTMMVRMALGR